MDLPIRYIEYVPQGLALAGRVTPGKVAVIEIEEAVTAATSPEFEDALAPIAKAIEDGTLLGVRLDFMDIPQTATAFWSVLVRLLLLNHRDHVEIVRADPATKRAAKVLGAPPPYYMEPDEY